MAKKKHEPGPPPPAVRKAIAEILTDAWDAEERDYAEVILDGDDPTGKHIFEQLVRVNNWLEGKKDRVRDCVEVKKALEARPQ